MRLLVGCVATAVSDAGACLQAVAGKLLQRCPWPRSLFAFVDAAGVFVDIHTSSCTPLVQLSSDLSVPNYSGHVRNSLPTFGLPLKGQVLCHSICFMLHCFHLFQSVVSLPKLNKQDTQHYLSLSR